MNLLRDLPDAGAAEIVERLAGNGRGGAHRTHRLARPGEPQRLLV